MNIPEHIVDIRNNPKHLSLEEFSNIIAMWDWLASNHDGVQSSNGQNRLHVLRIRHL